MGVDFRFLKINERIKALEEKVFKNSKKTETTRAQQILLMKHSGIIDFINGLGMSKKNTALFISLILNRSSENIEDDLRYLETKESPIKTKNNYEFVIQAFKDLKLNTKITQLEKESKNLE